MAGTRGIAKFETYQLRNGLMRDGHFDVNHKINEDKIDIQWAEHREILEATKIDVFVQKNGVNVGAGTNTVEITADILNKNIAADGVEGIVLDVPVVLRKNGSVDFPFIDADGDKVYGKVRHESTGDKFFLDFYSLEGQPEVETAYTFADAVVVDYKYVTRTNLSVIPANAIVNAGSAFVEGATDAEAYMNLNQLMKDLYGASGSLDNDGSANLGKSVLEQITDEVTARTSAVQAVRNDLTSTDAGKGATIVGVITDPNYSGANIQAVLSNLASRLTGVENGGGAEVEATHTRDTASANGYFAQKTVADLEARIVDVETVVDTELKAHADDIADHETRVAKLENQDDRYAVIATAGQTQVILPGGKKAKLNSLFFSLNGALQAPAINYAELLDGTSSAVIGIELAPDALEGTETIFLWWTAAN